MLTCRETQQKDEVPVVIAVFLAEIYKCGDAG